MIIHYVHYCHHNLKKCCQDTRSCVVLNVVCLPKVYIRHYYHGVIGNKKYIYISNPKFSKQKVWGKENRIYITYKNTVMPHGRHIYIKASDMEKVTICTYPRSDHALPHCKCVIRCFAKYPSINLADQETDDQYSDTSP